MGSDEGALRELRELYRGSPSRYITEDRSYQIAGPIRIWDRLNGIFYQLVPYGVICEFTNYPGDMG